MFLWINRIFKKSAPQEKVFEINVPDLIPPKQDIEIYLPEERIISQFKPNRKNILIIDDSKGITSIVEDFVAEIVDVTEYNVLVFYGLNAAFVMKATLKRLEELGLEKIDYAIIDIVLPGKMKVDNKYERLDGIDISIYLNKMYSLENFIFYSGNILNSYVDYIEEKIAKFKDHFNKNLKNYIILKGQSDEEVSSRIRKLFNK